MRFRAFAAGKERALCPLPPWTAPQGHRRPRCAPCVPFRLECGADAGALKTCDLNWNLTLNLNLLCNLSKSKTSFWRAVAGLDRKCLISKFWRRRHAAEGPNDVVLRIELVIHGRI